MKMHDLNHDCEKTILLIHPMLSCANAMKIFIADYLGDEYQYLIPDLSDHEQPNQQIYQSAALEAKAIYEYLKEHQLSYIHFAFGASLGGVVLFELLKYPDLSFGHIFFEGVSFQEHARLANFVTNRVFLSKHRRGIADPALAVRKMAEIYGEQAARPMAKRFVAMRDESISHMVHDCAFVRLPELSAQMQKKCTFAFGEKDSDLKMAKKVQPVKYPYAEFIIWKGYDHCTKMTEDPKAYSQILKRYL